MEQFSRLDLLIKEEGISLLKQKTVLVIGCGGVGSYAIESLARSGIGHLILVDHDVIDVTNLNRQLMALFSNVGTKKVEVLKKRIEDINPCCVVDVIDQFITKDNLSLLFTSPVDFVVDAIDTVTTKMALISYCTLHQIPLIIALGTGNKMDPTQLEITTIQQTSYDPLARIIRKYVKDENITTPVMVVCSKEHPRKTGSNVIGSTAFVPSVAGLFCTSYVVRVLLKEESYGSTK